MLLCIRDSLAACTPAAGRRTPVSRVRLAHRRPPATSFLRFFESSDLRQSRQLVQRDSGYVSREIAFETSSGQIRGLRPADTPRGVARLGVLKRALEYKLGLFHLLVHSFFKDSFFDQIVFSAPDWRTRIGGAACRKTSAESTALAAAASPAQTPAATPAAAPPKPMPAQLPDVLARVNGEAVKKVDFDRLIKNLEVKANQPVPPDRRDEVYRRTLDELVTYTVLSQEIRARKVTVTDAEVDSHIQQLQSRFPTEDAFKKALDARGMTLEKLKEDTRIDISINKMVETEVASQQAPSAAQVREFYDKNPEKFKQDEAVRASHILFRVDEHADAASQEESHATRRRPCSSRRAAAPTSPSWQRSTPPMAARSRVGI